MPLALHNLPGSIQATLTQGARLHAALRSPGERPSPFRKPSRQLGYSSCHPSSRFALAFDAPRASVIISSTCLPPANFPSHAGTWRGGLPPTASARNGSHTDDGAGSWTTTFEPPTGPRYTVATFARAAA